MKLTVAFGASAKAHKIPLPRISHLPEQWQSYSL